MIMLVRSSSGARGLHHRCQVECSLVMTVLGSLRASCWNVAGPKLATGSFAETVACAAGPSSAAGSSLQMACEHLAPSLQLDPLLQPVQFVWLHDCGRTLTCSWLDGSGLSQLAPRLLLTRWLPMRRHVGPCSPLDLQGAWLEAAGPALTAGFQVQPTRVQMVPCWLLDPHL
jgi:hypothetical protein